MFKILHNIFKIPKGNSPKFLFSRCIQYCHKNTFNYRILEFFENSLYEGRETRLEKFSDTNLKLTPNRTKLNNIENYVNTLKNTTDDVLCKIVFGKLNTECFSLLHEMSPKEILKLLCILLKCVPEKMAHAFMYQKSIAILCEAVKEQSLTSNEIVQVLYCMSFQRRKAQNDVKNIIQYLPDFEDISRLEVVIVALACFKTGVKLNRKQTLFIESTLEKHADELMGDLHSLTVLCKSLRHSGISENMNLTSLSDKIVESKPIKISASAHILMLYSEGLLFYPNALERLIKDSLDDILPKNVKPVRIKDVTNFLRAISQLNCKLTIREKEILKQFVESRFQEYKNELDMLLNTCLSLIMLNVSCKQMCVSCIHNNILFPILQTKDKKTQTNLRLLLRMVEIMFGYKASAVYSSLPLPYFVVTECFHQAFETISSAEELYNVKIECPVQEIPIPGITFWHKKTKYHVDITDKKSFLKGTNIPHGLLNLKLRLLKILKYRCIQIHSKYILEEPKVNAFVMEQIRKEITS